MSGVPQKLVSKYKIDYGLILNLLCSGVTNDFHVFSENAMIYKDIHKHIDLLSENELKQREKMEEQISNNESIKQLGREFIPSKK